MEFPDLGKNCSRSECKALDFLPFTCSHCQRVYCKDHYGRDGHDCDVRPDDRPVSQTPVQSFPCSTKGCKTANPVEMLCTKCKRHFCLVHKFHDCFDIVDNIEEKKRLWNEPKEQFAKSIKVAEREVSESIQRAIANPKKQATAIKVQLMKLKGKAKGSQSIPTVNRLYFLVALPKALKKESKPVFVSNDWSLGKVIDSVSSLCDVTNRNNEMNSEKLRLFKVTDGSQVSNDTSSKMGDLINENRIYNGETLILEYVHPSEDLANYTLTDFSNYN